MATTTRPCQPGDVLANCSMPCGAEYRIEVVPPQEHPASGETDDHDVLLELTVFAPTADNGGRTLLPSLIDSAVQICGDCVNGSWGYNPNPLRHQTKRHQYVRRSGLSVANTLVDLVAMGNAAITEFQRIADRHAASVAAQQSARASAYAAYQVQV